MKRVLVVVVVFVVLAQAGSAPTRAVSPQATAAPTETPTVGMSGALPAPPLPGRPIPYHRPGRPSKAAHYTAQVTRLNAEGLAETVELTGLDALLADGTMDDPLQGNYRLVAENQVLVGALGGGNLRLSSVDVYSDTGPPPLVLNPLDGTAHTPAVGALQSDVTAGDLNGDYLDEQVAAWLDASGYVRLSVGAMPVTPELPGVTPPKVTSAPAAVAHSDGQIDLVLRGYDDALWHRHYDGSAWGSWSNDLSSRLLSGPAIASRADGQFDVFVIGGGNLTYRRHWEAGGWSGAWAALDDATDWEPLDRELPSPELPAPAAVVRGGDQLDLFRLAPDNTLRWLHWDDVSGWGEWQDLGGMLASGPGAVAHDGQIDVFARGVDEALWYLTYDGDWGAWRRLELDGVPEGVTVASTPAAVSLGAGQVGVYVRGSDDQLWWNQRDAGVWAGWKLCDVGDKSTTGRVGGALALDGVDDHVQVDYSLNQLPLTVGMWFYMTQDATYSNWPEGVYLFSNDDPSHWGFGVSVSQSENKLVVQRHNGWDYSDVVVPLNEWHHVAVVYDGSEPYQLYLDGTEVMTGTTESTLDGKGYFWIGGNPANPADQRYFAGRIDEVAVFTRTLSAAEILTIYQSGWDAMSGKAVGLHVDESPAIHGTTLTDTSGLGNHGTLYTGETWETLASAPAAVAHGGQVDVFARTGHDLVARAYYDGSAWGGWHAMEPLHFRSDYSSTAQADTRFPVRVQAGYFLGGGRQQLAVAYVRQSDKHIAVDLWDPRLWPWGPVASKTFDIGLGSYGGFSGADFDLTAGDFDGDGSDEIAIASAFTLDWLWFPYTLRLDLFDVALVDGVWGVQDLHATNPHWTIAPPGYQDLNVDVAAGDADGDTFDEVALAVAGVYHSDSDYTALKYVVDGLEAPSSVSTCWLHHNVLEDLADRSAAALGNVIPEPPGVPIKDEVVFAVGSQDWLGSWHWVEVYEFKPGAPTCLEIKRYWPFNDPHPNPYDWALEVGDVNNDLVEEIALAQCWSGAIPVCLLRLYRHDQPAGLPMVGTAIGAVSDVSLAMGDFAGQSLRVGPPTYRSQKEARQLFAVINTPPRHKDTIDGQVIDVNSETPNTYVRYENSSGEVTEMSNEVNSSWGIATGLEITAGDPEGTHVTTSVENTYGQDFGNVTTTYSETIAGLDLYARYADLVQYAATDYYVYEYPLYRDEGATPASYVTVVIPQVVWPDDHGGVDNTYMSGESCGSSYRPNHQLDSLLSYPDHASDFTDFQGGQLLKQLEKLAIGGVEYDSYFEWSDVIEDYRSRATNLGVSAGVEAQVGGDKIPLIGVRIPWSVKVSFKGSYERGTLSTHGLTARVDTSLHVIMEDVANAYNYSVTPFMYWAEDGYLVVDYVTDPDPSKTFWATSYALPDPAFNLPWLDGTCVYGEEYSKEIVIEPPYAHVGDTVTITATVRNLSLNPASTFSVDFYHGDPDAGGTKINTAPINLSLDARDVARVSTQWTAQGVGEQRIYAVIDRGGHLAEVHDEADALNNNKAFGMVHIGAARFVDPGQAAVAPYQPLRLAGGTQNLDITAYVPRGFTQTVQFFELTYPEVDATVLGEPFELAVYDAYGNKVRDLNLQKTPLTPPASIAIYYGEGRGVSGQDLKLYVRRGLTWEDATWELAENTCADQGGAPLYEVQRFPDDDLIVVPVCQTGIYSVSSGGFVYLPLVLRNY